MPGIYMSVMFNHMKLSPDIYSMGFNPSVELSFASDINDPDQTSKILKVACPYAVFFACSKSSILHNFLLF